LPAFWIANGIGRIDPAYVRRFDIVLEIKPPPRNVRRRILEQCLDGLPVRPSWIDQQAVDGDLAPATAKRIAKVLRAAEEGTGGSRGDVRAPQGTQGRVRPSPPANLRRRGRCLGINPAI
jgi:hypothetical protein